MSTLTRELLETDAPQVDQDFAIVKDAYPFVASRLLTDRSPQLQSALKQLIFKDGQVVATADSLQLPSTHNPIMQLVPSPSPLNQTQVRWSYLEGLIENAVQTSDYDMMAMTEQVRPTRLHPDPIST